MGSPGGRYLRPARSGPDTYLLSWTFNFPATASRCTLIEISNGYDDTMLPTSAPAGCEFTDVAASDWFAGWVWQACDDGLMNGVGGGLFDPNNLLTRGQVATILNNIFPAYVADPAAFGGFIVTGHPAIYGALALPFPGIARPHGPTLPLAHTTPSRSAEGLWLGYCRRYR
ncbi:MAG: S-layer homology domain-containing protein [Anaerolineales bacterium]|nr:S-layer homology domain-containing protein [Anaerolineales bacterium]